MAAAAAAIPFMKRKSTPYVIGGGVLLVILILVYFSGKKAGKSRAPKDKPLPTGGQGIPIVGIDASGNQIAWSPDALAKELFDVLDGFDTSGTQEPVFGAALSLTDDQLTAVYNRWNNLYYDKENMTLTEWLNSEWWKGDKGVALLHRLRSKNLTFNGETAFSALDYGGANWGAVDPLTRIHAINQDPVGGTYVQYDEYGAGGDMLQYEGKGCGCGCGGKGSCGTQSYAGKPFASYDLMEAKTAYTPEIEQLRAKTELLSRRLKKNGLV